MSAKQLGTDLCSPLCHNWKTVQWFSGWLSRKLYVCQGLTLGIDGAMRLFQRHWSVWAEGGWRLGRSEVKATRADRGLWGKADRIWLLMVEIEGCFGFTDGVCVVAKVTHFYRFFDSVWQMSGVSNFPSERKKSAHCLPLDQVWFSADPLEMYYTVD